MRIDVQEFRRACDTLVEFTQQHTGLTDEDRNLAVMVVRALKQTLAPSSSPAHEERRSVRPTIKHPLIDCPPGRLKRLHRLR